MSAGYWRSAAIRQSTRIPNLDGIRAIAVLAVLAWHAGLSYTPGGFLGVDMFFVLSGFLITWLLLGEHDSSGSIRLLQFYGRRAVRLFPALLVMLGIALPWAFTHSEDIAHGTIVQLPWALAYASNWQSALFWSPSDSSLLAHTWSLGVEEQFYLLWPLILIYLLQRRVDRSRLALVLVGLACSEAIYRAVTWHFGLVNYGVESLRLYFRQYSGTDFRSYGLLLGCALAMWLSAHGWAVPRLIRYLCLPSVPYIALEFRNENLSWLENGGYLVFAVAVTVVLWVLAVDAPRLIVTEILESWPVRSLGRISYGVYLYSYPIIYGWGPSNIHWAGPWAPYAYIALTIGVAALSFVLVEKPLMDRYRTRHTSRNPGAVMVETAHA